jgi:hypothetical protein
MIAEVVSAAALQVVATAACSKWSIFPNARDPRKTASAATIIHNSAMGLE